MRIVHIITGLNVGGAEIALLNLLSSTSLVTNDISVVVLRDNGPIGDKIKKLGIPVLPLGISKTRPSPLSLIQLIKILRNLRPDIVQTWMYHADLVGGIAAKIAGGSKISWGIHHTALDKKLDTARTVKVMRLCAILSGILPDKIICCSQATLDAHHPLGYNLKKLTIIPNGFDLQEYRPDKEARKTIREELGISSETPLIGLAGRFHPLKDHRNFIQAAGLLLTNNPNVQFLLCGTNITYDNFDLSDLIRRYANPSHFHLLGQRNDMKKIYASLDIYTSSSIGEAFPLVIGEAMACGTPCVVTDVGDSAIIVKDTGHVVPPKDHHALAEAWAKLLSLPTETRIGLGATARNRIRKKFNLTLISEKYQNVYAALLEQEKPQVKQQHNSLLSILWVCLTIMALLYTNDCSASTIPVFPGADGFGSKTPAGRNGKIFMISNLNSNGPNSLNECLKAEGPRVCIFSTSGTIRMTEDTIIRNPYLTVAGQTAPYPGITIQGAGLRIATHDVLLQHLRIRHGDDSFNENQDGDCLGIYGKSHGALTTYNIVIDHCSFSWGIDENVSLWSEGIRDVTLSNNIISEALGDSRHPWGNHSCGLLIGDHSKNIAVIGNLFAHNHHRNPTIKGNTNTVVAHNVIYNPTWAAIQLNDPDESGAIKASIFNNVVIPGIDTRKSLPILRISKVQSATIYLNNNIFEPEKKDQLQVEKENSNVHFTISSPIDISSFNIRPVNTVKNMVLSNAGAHPRSRDQVDKRIINDVLNLTGKNIDCVDGSAIYNPKGFAQTATEYSIVLDQNASKYDDRYGGSKELTNKSIEITAGKGKGQKRRVIDYTGSSKTAIVDSAWDSIPDNTSEYNIINDCLKNAGGWPTVKQNFHQLSLPSNPNKDSNNNGYTNLEEWIHEYSETIEKLEDFRFTQHLSKELKIDN